MNLALHIFKKDVRHLRGLLVAWVLLVAVQAGLSGSGLAASADNIAWEIAFGIISFLVPLLQALVIFAVVPLLIQDEPLVGTTAFWFTRPIARKELLQAKVLFCGGLLVLVPAVVELAVLAANQAALGQLALAVPEILLNRLGTLLLVAALAVLTPSFARFVLYAVLLLVAFVIVYFLIYIVAMFVNPLVMLKMAKEPSLAVSRSIVSDVIGLAGYSAVVWHQYLRRKTWISALLLGVTLLATMAIAYAWPWDFMPPKIAAAAAADYDDSGVRVYLKGQKLNVSDQFRMSGKENRMKSVSGCIRAENGPLGFELRPRVVNAGFTFADGFQTREPGQNFSFLRGAWNRPSLEQALGGSRILGDMGLTFENTGLFSLKEADYKIHGEQPGKLEAKVGVDVYRYVVKGVVPLKARERIDLGAEQAVITDVLDGGDNCAVILRERTLRLMFDRTAPVKNPYAKLSRNVLYVLRNPARQEAVLPNDDNDPDMSDVFSRDQRLSIHSMRLEYGGSDKHGNRGIRLDANWLAGAELVRVEAVKAHYFEKTLVAEGVLLRKSGGLHSAGQTSKAEIDAALDKIQYPENPTEPAVRAYIRAIARASEGQRSWSDRDRQVALLQKVGPEYVRLLFEEIPDSYHLRPAALPLITEADKAWVIENLRAFPWLVKAVWRNNWMAEAHDVLVRGVKEQWEDVPSEWFKAAASFQDPATYDDLVNFFVSQDDRDDNFKVLQGLEGMDLDAGVARAWQNAKYGSEYETYEMVPIAIHYGHLDALRMGVLDILADPEECNWSHRQICEAVTARTGVGGSDADIVAWYRANEGQLVFDRNTRMFKVVGMP